MPRELNVTSYAILGLLAMREWAAYDLTKEMQRNLVFFWPRAESAIYVEAKRLDEAGLATTRIEMQGRRRRTIYGITEAGREALRDWLAEPAGRGAQLEAEGLLRVFVAGALAPDPAAVLSAVEAIQRDAEALIRQGWLVGGEFIEGAHAFQHQLRWRAHVNDFLVRYALLLADWAQRTHELVAQWDGDERAVTERAAALVADAHERLEAAPVPLPSDPATSERERDDGS